MCFVFGCHGSHRSRDEERVSKGAPIPMPAKEESPKQELAAREDKQLPPLPGQNATPAYTHTQTHTHTDTQRHTHTPFQSTLGSLQSSSCQRGFLATRVFYSFSLLVFLVLARGEEEARGISLGGKCSLSTSQRLCVCVCVCVRACVCACVRVRACACVCFINEAIYCSCVSYLSFFCLLEAWKV